MMVMISDDSQSAVGPALRELIRYRVTSLHYVSVDRLHIRHCTACNSCSGKTFGRCVIEDDMQTLLPYIAHCSSLVLVSPVIFGGVGFRIKQIMDRMLAVAKPHYRYRSGELVKVMKNEGLAYYIVGRADGLSPEEESTFLTPHRENTEIMSTRAGPSRRDPTERTALEQVAEGIIHG